MTQHRLVTSTLARTGLLLAGLLCASAAQAASAPRGEAFLIGASPTTGAVCRAVRDFDDPVIAAAGRKATAQAWLVACEGVREPIGRLYRFDGAQAVSSQGAWAQASARRATCAPGQATAVDKLASVTRSACKRAEIDYVTLVSAGRTGLAAEGLASYEDLLRLGLAQVAGLAPSGGSSLADVQAGPADAGATGAAGRLNQSGYLNGQAARYSLAEEDFRAVLSSRQVGEADDRSEAEAMLNLALAVSNLGRFPEAEQLFAQADAKLATAKDAELTALALNYKALDARNRGDLAKAVGLAQKAIAARPSTLDGEAAAQGPAGQVVISRNDAALLNRSAASTVVDRQNRMAPSSRWALQDAQAYQVIATGKIGLGDRDGAQAAATAARAALARANAPGAGFWIDARVSAAQAEIDFHGGRKAEAEALLVKAIGDLASRQAGSPAEALLKIQLANAQLANGKRDAARRTFADAFNIYRAAHEPLGPTIDRTGGYFDLLLADYQAAAPGDRAAIASEFFSAAESSMSASMSDVVSKVTVRLGQGEGKTAELKRRLDDADRLVEINRTALARLQASSATAADIARASAALRDSQVAAAALTEQLAALNPGYASVSGTNAGLGSLQKALQPGEVYLRIVVLADKSFMIAVTRDSATPYAAPLSRAQAQASVDRLRDFVDKRGLTRPFDVAASYALFQQLAGPEQDRIRQATRLVYVADGALISLPPSLLVTDKASVDLIDKRRKPGRLLSYEGVSWLGAKTNLSLAMSSESFVSIRALKPAAAGGGQRQSFLGFGDPQGDATDPRLYQKMVRASGDGASLAGCQAARTQLLGLRRLPETAVEVRDIASSMGAPAGDAVVGGQFTDTAVKARGDLSQFNVLYFATHGLLPEEGECLPQPALVTSLGAGDLTSDGLLDAEEIVALKLNADLVVLAACDTGGKGADTAAGTGLKSTGEALGGLAQSFVFAGARNLLISHWAANSATTAPLMTTMFRSGEGQQDQALRKAQLSLMTAPASSHPYYWAAFTVVGDGARAMPGGGQ